ncbi:hypothetical protein HK102_006778 [Quaeritorhiza haematococci]|nr:hypothetical protein HK102_006778 [Quaeritorhiza haematococci]
MGLLPMSNGQEIKVGRWDPEKEVVIAGTLGFAPLSVSLVHPSQSVFPPEADSPFEAESAWSFPLPQLAKLVSSWVFRKQKRRRLKDRCLHGCQYEPLMNMSLYDDCDDEVEDRRFPLERYDSDSDDSTDYEEVNPDESSSIHPLTPSVRLKAVLAVTKYGIIDHCYPDEFLGYRAWELVNRPIMAFVHGDDVLKLCRGLDFTVKSYYSKFPVRWMLKEFPQSSEAGIGDPTGEDALHSESEDSLQSTDGQNDDGEASRIDYACPPEGEEHGPAHGTSAPHPSPELLNYNPQTHCRTGASAEADGGDPDARIEGTAEYAEREEDEDENCGSGEDESSAAAEEEEECGVEDDLDANRFVWTEVCAVLDGEEPICLLRVLAPDVSKAVHYYAMHKDQLLGGLDSAKSFRMSSAGEEDEAIEREDIGVVTEGKTIGTWTLSILKRTVQIRFVSPDSLWKSLNHLLETGLLYLEECIKYFQELIPHIINALRLWGLPNPPPLPPANSTPATSLFTFPDITSSNFEILEWKGALQSPLRSPQAQPTALPSLISSQQPPTIPAPESIRVLVAGGSSEIVNAATEGLDLVMSTPAVDALLPFQKEILAKTMDNAPAQVTQPVQAQTKPNFKAQHNMLGNEEAKRLEADRLHLLDENSTLRRLLARSQSENKSLLSTCLAQRSSLEEAVRHLELATSSTTAAAAAALASATERNAALESELGEVRGERDEAVRMVEEMRGMWTKERREWEELMVGKVGEVEREKTAAERALRKKLQERDREVVVLRRRATDLENEVRRASDKADRARVLEDQLNALNAENQSLRDDIQHLRSSLDQYLLGRQSLLAENKALQSGLRHEQEESAQTKAHLESRIRNLEDAIDSLRGQSKEEEVNSKRTAMQAKGKYESLKKVAEGLKEESKKWKKVAEASQSAVDAMNGKLKDVQRTLESARETNGRLMERVEAAEMQRSKAEILESALAKVAAEKDAMSKVVAQLKMHASNVGTARAPCMDLNLRNYGNSNEELRTVQCH